MNKYKLTIAYDGTPFSGWQRQKGALSIQELIEEALQTILRHKVHCVSSSRTDAGVHAKGQVAHFKTAQLLNPSKILYSLNALLPPTIRILGLEPAAPDFHARYSALSKIYHYHLHLDPVSDPLMRLYRYRPHGRIDLDRLRLAIPHFLGRRDFFSFANDNARGSASRNSIRTLMRLDLVPQPGGIRLEFEGDGFLYKMVRNITGTLLEVGRGKKNPHDIPLLLSSRNRRAVGLAAPPHGLHLISIRYP